MSKEEYISSLKVALQGFEEDLIQEIVTDYEERFIVGIENGKTEEQIITELGSVEQLVMELKELQSFDTSSLTDWKIGKKKSNTLENKINQTEEYREEDIVEEHNEKTEQTKKDTENFDWNFENLMKNVGKVVERAVKKAEEAMERAELYVKVAKRKHFEDNSTIFEDMEKESDGTYSITQFGESKGICHKIVIDAGIGDVKIQKTNESVVKVECHYYSHKTAMAYPFYTKQQEDVFYIGIHKVEDTKSGFFQFQLAPAVKIEVFLPETIQEVEVTTSSGDVEGKEVIFGDLKLRSSSGDIKLKQVTGDSYFIETMSGDVTVRDSTANKAEIIVKSGDCEFFNMKADTISVSSKSGNLEIDGLQAETVILSTMSGDQEMNHLQVQELKATTASGDIEVENSVGKSIIQSSASGDIDVNADFKEYNLQSKSGDINVINHYDATICVASISGDVTVEMFQTEENYQVEMSSVSGECHVSGDYKKETTNEVYRMEVKSISGDVFVRFRG